MTGHEDFQREVPVSGSSDRAFGFVFAAFLFLVGVWPLVRQQRPRLWAVGVALALALIAVTRPGWLHLANVLWSKLGLLLSKIVNPVVTGIMFFLVVTPVALVMRLLGQDPLRLRYDRGAASYWLPRHPPGPPPESMSRQF